MTAPDREPIVRDVHTLAAAIAGTPVAWKRPSSGRRKHTDRHHAYLGWREQVGWIVDDERRRQRLPKPITPTDDLEVAVTLDFVGAAKTADVDNLTKAVLDGLQGIAYYDDKQVTSLAVRRHPQHFGARGLLVELTTPITPMTPADALDRLADAVERYDVPPTDRRTA